MSRLYNALHASEENLAEWYLRTNDNAIYGPVTLATLIAWAVQNRIAPGNQISSSQKEWRPAETLPDLEMDWMAALAGSRPYGPFNVRAAPELVRRGHIDPDSVLINQSTGERVAVRRLLDVENRQLELDSFLELTVGEHEVTDRPSRRQPPHPEQPVQAAVSAVPAGESGALQLPLNLSHPAIPRPALSGETGQAGTPDVNVELLSQVDRLSRLLAAERERGDRLEKRLPRKDQTHTDDA